jgi:uncharacterized membrane protein
MSPWDIRSAILAKHAQHVVLTHFPIALFLTGVAFDFAANWTKRATVAAAAYANLLVAAVFSAAGGRVGDFSLAMVSLVCSSVGLVGSACAHGGARLVTF